jgi:hypothetical protein
VEVFTNSDLSPLLSQIAEQADAINEDVILSPCTLVLDSLIHPTRFDLILAKKNDGNIGFDEVDLQGVKIDGSKALGVFTTVDGKKIVNLFLTYRHSSLRISRIL